MRTGARVGFTLIELLVVIAIIALLVAILLPSLGEARRAARQSQNVSNLKQYGTATQSYASEFRDLVWAFTWRAPVNGVPANFRTDYTDLASAANANDTAAAASQAVDILRRRAPNLPNFPIQANWIPHILYSHLVLLDYLAARLPEPMVRSPEDRVRAQWAEDVPRAIASLQSTRADTASRWPFSSSYSVTCASFAPDRETADGGSLQSVEWNSFQISTTAKFRLGGRKLGDVVFPASKVHVYETIMRHVGKKPMPYIHYAAQTTVCSFDGSVRVIDTKTANKGGYTRASGVVQQAIVAYPLGGAADIGEPAWPDTSSPERPLYYRHTADGLKGIDFGAKSPVVEPSYSGIP